MTGGCTMVGKWVVSYLDNTGAVRAEFFGSRVSASRFSLTLTAAQDAHVYFQETDAHDSLPYAGN